MKKWAIDSESSQVSKKKSHCGEPHNSSLDHLKSKNQNISLVYKFLQVTLSSFFYWFLKFLQHLEIKMSIFH